MLPHLAIRIGARGVLSGQGVCARGPLALAGAAELPRWRWGRHVERIHPQSTGLLSLCGGSVGAHNREQCARMHGGVQHYIPC